jgi:hypothetical protein
MSGYGRRIPERRRSSTTSSMRCDRGVWMKFGVGCCGGGKCTPSANIPFATGSGSSDLWVMTVTATEL